MHCHEGMLESGGIAPPFLTSALNGGECSVSRPCRFTPGDRSLGTHEIAGWVGPRTGVDVVEKRKISCPCLYSKPDRPVRRLVAVPTANHYISESVIPFFMRQRFQL
jgi:hypothetical protein